MPNTSDELRKLWRQHHEAHTAWAKAWRATGYQHPAPPSPPFPEELRDMTCGAKTRAGTPCKRRDLYISGRCKLHGGLSTGPKRKPSASRTKRTPLAVTPWRVDICWRASAQPSAQTRSEYLTP